MNIGVLQWWRDGKSMTQKVPSARTQRPQPRVEPEEGQGQGQAPHLTVWSQIFTVQSELQDMKTLLWYGFQDTASTAMLWAS